MIIVYNKLALLLIGATYTSTSSLQAIGGLRYPIIII